MIQDEMMRLARWSGEGDVAAEMVMITATVLAADTY